MTHRKRARAAALIIDSMQGRDCECATVHNRGLYSDCVGYTGTEIAIERIEEIDRG